MKIGLRSYRREYDNFDGAAGVMLQGRHLGDLAGQTRRRTSGWAWADHLQRGRKSAQGV